MCITSHERGKKTSGYETHFLKILGEFQAPGLSGTPLKYAPASTEEFLQTLGRFCIANIRSKFRLSGAGYENCYESGWNAREYSNLDEYICR